MGDDPNRELASAVLIPAPPPVVAFIEAFREQYAGGAFFHVPPHLTVMWPFVSPGRVADGADPALLAETTAKLREICQKAAPFSVTLDHYASFSEGVLYLAPQNPEPIVSLHRLILSVFPDYPPYGGAFNGFVPHMTLVIFESEDTLQAVPRPDFEPFTFRVTELHFMYGDLEAWDRWTLAATIPLGG
jgi:2'-5' RNA ligase